MRIFLIVSSAEQERRIELREGPEKLIQFQNRWIPLEERYFLQHHVEAACDLTYET